MTYNISGVMFAHQIQETRSEISLKPKLKFICQCGFGFIVFFPSVFSNVTKPSYKWYMLLCYELRFNSTAIYHRRVPIYSSSCLPHRPFARAVRCLLRWRPSPRPHHKLAIKPRASCSLTHMYLSATDLIAFVKTQTRKCFKLIHSSPSRLLRMLMTS